MNIFLAMVSKQMLIELSPFKTCVYLALITLFISNGDPPPTCATLEKVTIAHTFRVREINSLPNLDQYESSIHCNAFYPEAEMRPTRSVVLSMHFVINAFSPRSRYTRTARALVCTNCLSFQRDLVSLLCAILFSEL